MNQLSNVVIDFTVAIDPWKEKDQPMILGWANEGIVTLSDGTTMLCNSKSSGAVKGYRWTDHPQFHQVKSATFKGKMVRHCGLAEDDVRILNRTYVEDATEQYIDRTIQVPVEVMFRVEGVKKVYKEPYDSRDHKAEVFIIRKFLHLPKEFNFNPLAEFSVSASWGSGRTGYISYNGGGYGERYYVSDVGLKEGWVLSQFLRGTAYLKQDFLDHLIGYNEEDGHPFLISFPPIYKTSNWKVEVRHERYEGYLPESYVLSETAIAEVNQIIERRMSTYAGNPIKDWRTIDPASV